MRPYDVEAIPSYEEMMLLPAQRMTPEGLRPTQDSLMIGRLLALHRGEPAEGPDPCVHLVAVDGQTYIHNGHHRWIAATLRRDWSVPVRVYAVP